MAFKARPQKNSLKKKLESSFRDVEMEPVIHKPAFDDARGHHPETFTAAFTGVCKREGNKVKGHLVDTPSQGPSFIAYGPYYPQRPVTSPEASSAPAERPRKLAFDFKL